MNGSLGETIKIKKHKSSINYRKDDLIGYLMLSPSLIFFVLLTVYPVCWALQYMFFDYDGITHPIFTGAANFVRAFTKEKLFWKSVLNTLGFAFIKLIIEFPLALVLGTLLNSKLIKGKNFFRGLFFVPCVLSSAIISLIFSFILSPYNGMLNNILTKLNLIEQNINWLGTGTLAMVCCIFLAVWQNFGQNCILVIAGLQNIPNELYESANMDGATVVQSFFNVTLPMIAPMLKTILMLAIIGSLNSFESIYVLTKGGPNHFTEVMSINVYNYFFSVEKATEYGYGASLGFLSSIVIGVFTCFYLFASKRIDKIFD